MVKNEATDATLRPIPVMGEVRTNALGGFGACKSEIRGRRRTGRGPVLAVSVARFNPRRHPAFTLWRHQAAVRIDRAAKALQNEATQTWLAHVPVSSLRPAHP